MMYVTTKGQVTIPMELREKYEIYPHTEVEFIEEEGKIYIKKKKTPGEKKNRFQKYRGIASVKMTTDEIMALTRE
jgi:AbrB family looped-hinge helix DNA binding protein